MVFLLEKNRPPCAQRHLAVVEFWRNLRQLGKQTQTTPSCGGQRNYFVVFRHERYCLIFFRISDRFVSILAGYRVLILVFVCLFVFFKKKGHCHVDADAVPLPRRFRLVRTEDVLADDALVRPSRRLSQTEIRKRRPGRASTSFASCSVDSFSSSRVSFFFYMKTLCRRR